MNLSTYLPSLPSLANEKLYTDCHHCVQLKLVMQQLKEYVLTMHGVLYCIFIIQQTMILQIFQIYLIE